VISCFGKPLFILFPFPGFHAVQTYQDPRMELVTGGLSTNASEAVSAILAMRYVELRAIVVAAIVRNTNDKTKMT
jgi:hypothetical protein